ncbi:MAG: cobyrinate a,c-diamide synthase, partial [Chloroflexi bacterium]|nr:cobyrinate a,c-diamide synthase [Chloroflexota bacterium]
SWMLSGDGVRELFGRPAIKSDVCVIEGLMGLYDGRFGEGETGSTAHIAKLLDAPVVLVVDAAKVARSAAATVLGYRNFDPTLNLAGVILNNLGSPRHGQMIEEAITETTGLPVLGKLRRHDDLRLPERHLGLVTAIENPLGPTALDRLIDRIEIDCDVDALLALARSAPLAPPPTGSLFPAERSTSTARIGIALDPAFSFYYEDNWNLVSLWGAELIPFSPLNDGALPDNIHGLYFGGGYPEVHAEALAHNASMRASIRAAHAAGMPIFAECGGFMYLCDSIVDFDGRAHEMVGLIPARTVMEKRRVGLGYREVRARQDTLLLPAGETARCHEFHWSRLDGDLPAERLAFDVLGEDRTEGYTEGNLLASYLHFHFGSDRGLPRRLAQACMDFQAKQRAGAQA